VFGRLTVTATSNLKELIDRQIEANKSWERVMKNPIIHTTTRWQDELFMKYAL
jgi:hypothetical protein